MKVPNSRVVDEVPYADPERVIDRYVRNRDSFSDPGKETVYNLLLDRSDFVDSETGRAWRRRRVENNTTAKIKFSTNQKNPRKRKRSRYARGGGRRRLSPQRAIDPWVDATLPFNRIVEVDELVVVRGRDTEDITSAGPADIQSDPGPVQDGDWWIQPDRGRLKIDLHKFVRGERSISGRLITDDVHVRTTYTYGYDESGAVNASGLNDESNSVPGAIRDAVTKLVAADIAEMDQYGALFRQGSDDADLSGSASTLRSEAMEAINDYRRF
mgnify:CR=1 FL=1